jgi:hypothetical protein
MKNIKFIILSTFLLFGLKNFAQKLEIPSNLSKGDSIRVIMKSGLYNYGILFDKSDTSLSLYLNNQIVPTKLLYNRVAEVYILTASPKRVVYSNTKQKNKLAEQEKSQDNAKVVSRYFFAPSAIKQKAGTFVYDNSYAFINSLSYSVTDNVSITAGGELISALMGQPIVLLSPHAGFKVSDNLHLGGGFVYLNRENVQSTSIKAFYGTVTLGNNVKNVSINFGKGLDNASYSLNVSGYIKLKNNFALITENWFYSDNQIFDSEFPLIGFGGRVYGPKVNFDFALVNIVIPYLGFSYKFN